MGSTIRLGLERMRRLMPPQPWKVIHVAGTNGKGSICAYLAALFRHASPQLRTGQFTSPYLAWPADSIRVDGQVIGLAAMEEARAAVILGDPAADPPSPFEVLCLTAFEHFRRQAVDVAIIEVGLGGRLDATNVLDNKLVTVMAKIGLDHTEFLGLTVEAIAGEKAGILRPNVPCILDGSNSGPVLNLVRRRALDIRAPLLVTSDWPGLLGRLERDDDLEPHQQQNMACAILAYRAACHAIPALELDLTDEDLVKIAKTVRVPGRLYTMRVGADGGAGSTRQILLDGAHNRQSAEVLSRYVDHRLRPNGGSAVWMVSMSSAAGKDPVDVLAPLLRTGDAVVPWTFGPVDGMPWVRPVAADILRSAAVTLGVRDTDVHLPGPGSVAALGCALGLSPGDCRPVVVTGSLYGVQALLREHWAEGYAHVVDPDDHQPSCS